MDRPAARRRRASSTTASPSTTAARPARPARAAAARRAARAVSGRTTTRHLRLDRRRLARRELCGVGASTSCTSARSPRGHAGRGGRAARPPRRARRRPGRADAARAVPRPHGWGYDGVALCAVHEPYGGPDGAASGSSTPRTRPRPGRAPGRGLQPPRPVGQLPAASSARTSPTRTTRRGAPRSTSTAAGSDEVRALRRSTTRSAWLRDFHIDGLRLDAVHALADDRALHLPGGAVAAEVDALAARARPAAVPDRRVRPQRPAHRHARARPAASGCTPSGTTTSTTPCTSR